ncbi:MAG: protein kinase [Acidobacteria bacterium]|nr:protein kinase [Acidobacteriota bacterium]
MPLTAGERFAGHFEVTGVLGAGGMGEVYRARDTRLNRGVALKILPEAFAADADRLARFQREAELLASLNHPNIAQIHGIEEEADGTRALVLELVDGPTLEERIAEGPLPLDDALALAAQIADALEAAHEAGVIHRDLKPANVKVRGDGTVKVLDFGLAKALDAAPASGDPRSSPTMATAATRMGVIVGTAAYMAPEQARGRQVDRRVDVWAFGAVVYEMLTGRRAFAGDDATSTLAEVIKSEPAWEELTVDVPPAVSGVLRRCLQKDPKERLRDIGDVRLGLLGAFEDPERATAPSAAGAALPASGAAPTEAGGGWKRHWVGLTGAAVVIAAVAVGPAVWIAPPPPPSVAFPVRFTIPAAPNIVPFVEVSPDGRHLAYLESDGGREARLWIHSFETGQARELATADTAGFTVFWSPDSRFLAFSEGGSLRRIDRTSGSVETVCDTPRLFGGSWNGDDVIVFGAATGIMRVPAAGGTPVPLTTVDAARGELAHAAPRFLPDGRHFLYLRASSDSDVAGIYLGALDVEPAAQNPARLVATRQDAAYAPAAGLGTTGHLLVLQDDRLLAQPFDEERLALAGSPTVVTEGVGAFDVFAAFSVSRNGMLAYRGAEATRSVLWIEPTGQESAAAGMENLNDPENPRLSPDGRRLALIVDDDLWVFDLEGRPPIRLTFDGGDNASPLWTPDGGRIVYEGDGSLYSVSADGGGTPEPIGPQGHFHPHAWASNGDLIAVEISGERVGLVEFPAVPDAEARAVFRSPANEGFSAALSPDGRWLAYTSDATGSLEVWARPYPGPRPPVRISPRGGTEPVWARDGRALHYVEGRRSLMRVPVDASQGFEFAAPVRLFDADFVVYGQSPSYDVAPDGRLVTVRDDSIATVSVILNWPALLGPPE